MSLRRPLPINSLECGVYCALANKKLRFDVGTIRAHVLSLCAVRAAPSQINRCVRYPLVAINHAGLHISLQLPAVGILISNQINTAALLQTPAQFGLCLETYSLDCTLSIALSPQFTSSLLFDVQDSRTDPTLSEETTHRSRPIT